MLKWCAYCQTYQGEQEPRQDYRLTHVICRQCLATQKQYDGETVARLRPLSIFYSELRAKASRGDLRAARPMLHKGARLGIRPLDLLIGMIQPMLYEVGHEWEIGTLTAAKEHQFTSFSHAILQTVLEDFDSPKGLIQSRSPRVLNLCVEGNNHIIGPRILELILLEYGIPSHTITGGIPAEDALALIQELQPEVVGLSIATDSQVPRFLDTVRLFSRTMAANAVCIATGGYWVKMKSPLDRKQLEAPVTFCSEPWEIFPLLGMSNPKAQRDTFHRGRDSACLPKPTNR